MDKFTIHTGRALPLRRSNVDTDQIIPGEYLKRVTRHGYEDALFADWRRDSDFIMNQPAYLGVSVLVAGSDFGTGSSREHAVWALQDYGFRVILSSRFADIFRGNSGKIGLLTAVIEESVTEQLWDLVEADPTIEVTVDLMERRVRCGDVDAPFEIDDYVRWRLLEGLDDIGITLRHGESIDAFESTRSAFSPTTL